MRLVEDVRDSWRWLSMHAMALALAVQGAWLAMPDALRANVPAWVSYTVTGVLMIGGILGRLVNQSRRLRTDETDEAGV